MSNGDTAPAAAFNNVPRRQRSAARPSNDQELGDDASPGRVGSSTPAQPPQAPTQGDDGPTDVPEHPTVDAINGTSDSKSKVSAVPFFPGNAFVSDALRATLAGLGAVDLECVHRKVMESSDRRRGQNRLLVSCKKRMAHGCDGEQKTLPFAGVLTDAEWLLVHRTEPEEMKTTGKINKKKNKSGGGKDRRNDMDDQREEEKKKNTDKGLSVRAYDRNGRLYNVQLKYLSSNSGYRVIGPDWSRFLENNGLLVDGGATTRKRRKRSPGEEGSEERLSSSPDGEQDVEAVPPAVAVRNGKRRKRSPVDEASGEGTSSSPDEGSNGERYSPEQDAADDVIHIELWAFRSPEVRTAQEGLPAGHHPHGALGLLLLHRRDGEAVAVGVAGAAKEAQQDAAAPGEAAGGQPQQQNHNHHGGAVAAAEEEEEEAPQDAAAAAPDEAAGGQPQQEQNHHHGGAAAARDDEADAAGGVDDFQAQPAGNPDGGAAAPPPSRDPYLIPYEINAARGLLRIKYHVKDP